LTRDAVHAAEAAAGCEGVRLSLDPDLPPTVTDGERLRQALVNIVGNALQAVAESGKPGPPEVRVKTARSTTGVSPSQSATPGEASPPRTCRASSIPTSRRAAPEPASVLRSRATSSKGLGTNHGGQPAGTRHGRAHRAAGGRHANSMTKTRGSILLVDDEAKIRNALADALREEGHEVVSIGSPREAQRLLARGTFDVLIVDNLMPELTGLDLIRELVASSPAADRPQILMMTAHATVESAIEAMKLGALDYLQKPFEIDELLVVVNRALDHQRLRTQHKYLLSERDEEFNQYGIVGRSRRISEVIRTAEMVAKSKSTVLITGRTGTGKEMVARAIHYHSAQRDMPLVKVNCAAIPENLLESELFGHTRGAFTGALTNKKGSSRWPTAVDLPRRDRHDGAAATGEAAARAAGARVRAARVRAKPEGGRARDRRRPTATSADGVGRDASRKISTTG
jgi:DNA-binding response OmpR family regulator